MFFPDGFLIAHALAAEMVNNLYINREAEARMDDSVYRFEHVWRVDWEKERLWALISNFRYVDWWPGVEIARRFAGDSGDGLGNGYAAVFRTKLLYSLSLDATVVDVRPPNRIVLRVTGQLEGRAVIRLHGAGRATELSCLIELETRRPWMALFAPLLRPVFVWNHRQVMKAGRAGLSAYLGAAVVPGSVHGPYRRPARS